MVPAETTYGIDTELLGRFGVSTSSHKKRTNIGCHTHAFKIHTIFEGTSEIQQLVIARAISGLHIE